MKKTEKTKPMRCQLSLRSLLLVLSLAALILSWFSQASRRANLQREAVASVQRCGGVSRYDVQPSLNNSIAYYAPEFLVKRLGRDFFSTITQVEFNERTSTAVHLVDLESLANLSKLKHLTLCGNLSSYPQKQGQPAPMPGISSLALKPAHQMLPVEEAPRTRQNPAVPTPTTTLSPPVITSPAVRKYPLQDDTPDLSPLSNLLNLRFLSLRSSRVDDLSPLGALTKLENLELNFTQECDLSFLVKLVKLKRLNLNGTSVRNLSPLTHLAQLNRLELVLTQPVNLSPLSNLSKLEYLYLHSNANTPNLVPLGKLSELQELNLWLTDTEDLGDLSPLAKLTNLRKLNLCLLGESKDLDFSPLANLTNLTDLSLLGTNVTDLSPLNGLTKLKNFQLLRSNISPSEIESLQNALPKLNITVGNYQYNGGRIAEALANHVVSQSIPHYC